VAVNRSLVCDDVEWVAWVSGGSAYGTGNRGLGNVEAVHFAHASAPTVPVKEALIARGRFESLYDEELIEVLRAACKVVDPATVPTRPVGRRTLSG
jgi:hypothetical protein